LLAHCAVPCFCTFFCLLWLLTAQHSGPGRSAKQREQPPGSAETQHSTVALCIIIIMLPNQAIASTPAEHCRIVYVVTPGIQHEPQAGVCCGACYVVNGTVAETTFEAWKLTMHCSGNCRRNVNHAWICVCCQPQQC
jgi:hypothetical protein